MPGAHIRPEPSDAAGMATLRISNPGKMNAASLAMWRELRAFARPAFSEPGDRAAHDAYADPDEHREGLAAFIDKRPAKF